MRVVLASKNKHKLVEISQITEKFGFELVLQSELGVDIDVPQPRSLPPQLGFSMEASHCLPNVNLGEPFVKPVNSLLYAIYQWFTIR